MKPIPAILSDGNSAGHVFCTKEVVQPFFSTEFHFHKECQLVYVMESSGQRIVGDSVEHFENDELIFLGSDVPHVWHNEKKYFDRSNLLKAHSMTLFIDPEGLLSALSDLGDKRRVEEWLSWSRRGMVFEGIEKTELVRLLKESFHEEGLSKIITFLKIVKTMISASGYRLLASPQYVNSYSENDQERMDKLFKFIFTHFKREISLKEVASVVNMNEFSFCRFFKSRTQRSFTVFINELRIGHVCKLLQNRTETIDQLAYECGFNNVTHFNRQFKRLKGTTPREFRKQLHAVTKAR